MHGPTSVALVDLSSNQGAFRTESIDIEIESDRKLDHPGKDMDRKHLSLMPRGRLNAWLDRLIDWSKGQGRGG
jgi:hypothetical protein